MEVRLYLGKQLVDSLKTISTQCHSAWCRTIRNRLPLHLTRDDGGNQPFALANTEYFMIKDEDTDFGGMWFTGCLAIKRVLSDYYVSILEGRIIGGKASDFQAMALNAKDIYAAIALYCYPFLDDVAYKIPSGEIEAASFIFEYANSDKVV